MHSFSVKFYLRNAKRAGKPLDKECTIYCYLYLNGKQTPYPLPRKINAQAWDFKQQRAKKSRSSVAINAWLQTLKAELETYYQQHHSAPDEDLRAGLEQLLIPNTAAPKKETLFDIYQRFIDFSRPRRSPLTIKTYETGLRNLQKFAKDTGYACTFDKINLEFYDRYYAYWLSFELLNDTIDKRFALLKVFMKWAFERGYHQNLHFQMFKTARDNHHDIVTLTEEELYVFYTYAFENERMSQVRDLFCFAAFTGQRWGDVSTFNPADLSGNVWRFEMKKGKIGKKKRHEVPLIGFSKPAYDILRKHGGALPQFIEQLFNRYLKEAAQIAGIDAPVSRIRYSGNRRIEQTGPKYQFLSSHAARRSCATILLNKGISVAIVKELLGHSDIKTTMKYKNAKDSRVADALESVGTLVVSNVRQA